MQRIIGLCAAVAALMLSACAANNGATIETLPTGSSERGAELFSQSINGAPACSTCHTLDGSALQGPSFDGSTLLVSPIDGMTVEAYVYDSIVHPLTYIVEGYAATMYPQYNQRLSAQQIADLMAYVLAQ